MGAQAIQQLRGGEQKAQPWGTALLRKPPTLLPPSPPASLQIPEDSHWGSCRPLGESQVIMPPKAFHPIIFKAPVIKVGLL